MNVKKLYKGIDIFKLVAALGVVTIHTGIKFFDILGRLGVPFFVIVSSFFFFKHYFRLNNSIQRKNYIKKFLVRLGLLFLTWEVFYIPFAIIKFMMINNGTITIKSVLLYIFDFFYPVPSNANGWGPSWYLIAMFMALPIFIGVFYLLRKNLIILGILCVIIEFYFICANGYGYLTHWSTLGTYGFPRVMIYIYIGMLLAKFKDKIKAVCVSEAGQGIIYAINPVIRGWVKYYAGAEISRTTKNLDLFIKRRLDKAEKRTGIRIERTRLLSCHEVYKIGRHSYQKDARRCMFPAMNGAATNPNKAEDETAVSCRGRSPPIAGTYNN